jgi:hypothetical protein
MASKFRIGTIGLGAQGSIYAKLIAEGIVPNMEIVANLRRRPCEGRERPVHTYISTQMGIDALQTRYSHACGEAAGVIRAASRSSTRTPPPSQA